MFTSLHHKAHSNFNGNICIKIPSLPNICPSVTLSKLNWGGIHNIMTSLVPVDGQCILPRCVQLTSTPWQSHLSPHVYECILLSSGRLLFEKKLAPLTQPCFPLPKMCKETHFSYHFCAENRPSLTHTSLWHVKGHFYTSVDPLYAPFEICFTSVFAKNFLQKLILIYPRMQLGSQWQACTCFQFSYIVFHCKVAGFLPQRLGCRCFTRIYCELLAVSETLMLMGCGHHMCTGRIEGNMEYIITEYIFLNLLNM